MLPRCCQDVTNMLQDAVYVYKTVAKMLPRRLLFKEDAINSLKNAI